jgi:hypothetical protein
MLFLTFLWALCGVLLLQAVPIIGNSPTSNLSDSIPLLDTKVPLALAELSISPALKNPRCGKSYSNVVVSLMNRPDPASLHDSCGRLLQSRGHAMARPAVVSLICSSSDNIRSDPDDSKFQLAMVMKDNELAN